jgi:hypothetical protein
VISSAKDYALGKLDWNMQMVVICEKFGWTYDQFLDQPMFFIELIREKMKIDVQLEKNAMSQMKRK